jgi:hypothetical protein
MGKKEYLHIAIIWILILGFSWRLLTTWNRQGAPEQSNLGFGNRYEMFMASVNQATLEGSPVSPKSISGSEDHAFLPVLQEGYDHDNNQLLKYFSPQRFTKVPEEMNEDTKIQNAYYSSDHDLYVLHFEDNEYVAKAYQKGKLIYTNRDYAHINSKSSWYNNTLALFDGTSLTSINFDNIQGISETAVDLSGFIKATHRNVAFGVEGNKVGFSDFKVIPTATGLELFVFHIRTRGMPLPENHVKVTLEKSQTGFVYKKFDFFGQSTITERGPSPFRSGKVAFVENRFYVPRMADPQIDVFEIDGTFAFSFAVEEIQDTVMGSAEFLNRGLQCQDVNEFELLYETARPKLFINKIIPVGNHIAIEFLLSLQETNQFQSSYSLYSLSGTQLDRNLSDTDMPLLNSDDHGQVLCVNYFNGPRFIPFLMDYYQTNQEVYFEPAFYFAVGTLQEEYIQ